MARKVLAFGSFDILHPGHIAYLSKAKSLGDQLIVVVARDSSIRMFKKRKPFFNEKERLAIVGSLGIVDRAVLGNRVSTKEGIYHIISRFRPDTVAVGYDQTDAPKLRKELAKRGIKAKVIVIRGYNIGRYKSSKIRKKMGL